MCEHRQTEVSFHLTTYATRFMFCCVFVCCVYHNIIVDAVISACTAHVRMRTRAVHAGVHDTMNMHSGALAC